MKLTLFSTTAFALSLSGAAFASGDPAAGKKHFTLCAGCHGEQAQGNREQGAPRLAGQYAWYIARQLRNFRSGVRGAQAGDDYGALMSNFARTLPDEQAIDDVASYVESLGK